MCYFFLVIVYAFYEYKFFTCMRFLVGHHMIHDCYHWHFKKKKNDVQDTHFKYLTAYQKVRHPDIFIHASGILFRTIWDAAYIN